MGLDLFLQAVCFPCYGCVFDIDVTFPPQAEVINYKGDLNTPPDQVAPSSAELLRSILCFQPGGEEEEDQLRREEDEDGEGQGRRRRVK